MVMHARSGGNLEIMGLLLGKVDANVMVVMDSFALPVEVRIISVSVSEGVGLGLGVSIRVTNILT